MSGASCCRARHGDSGHALAGQELIAFNAGTRREVLHMRTAEFRRVAATQIVSLTREPVAAQGW